MDEAPLPAQSSLPGSLAPPSATVATPSSSLRASLRACTAEGLAAEVVGACFSGAVLTAWAVQLGASPVLLGVLWGLPHVGQVFQIPALWVTSHLGRKRAAVVLHAVARQATLPIAVLPFVDVSAGGKRAIVVGLFALSSVLSVLGHNAWLAWMGELVPARIRGAYFGRRTALCSAVATVASLTIAVALDRARSHAALGIVLSAILVLRSIAGVVTTVLMLRQHDPPSVVVVPRPRDLVRPIADRAYRKLLAYRAAWGIATGLGASLSAVYMLRALGLGFVGVATYSAAVAVLRIVTTPLWGRTLDREGGRRVLVACSFGAAVSSIAWVLATPASTWLIAVDALVSGLLLSGQELAAFTVPLSAAPSARRPLYAAVSVMVGGLAYGGASAISGPIADVVSLRNVLLAGVVWRILAAVVATGIEDGTRRTDALTPARPWELLRRRNRGDRGRRQSVAKPGAGG